MPAAQLETGTGGPLRDGGGQPVSPVLADARGQLATLAAAQAGSDEHRGWTVGVIAGMAAEPWDRPELAAGTITVDEDPDLDDGLRTVEGHMLRVCHHMAPHVAALLPVDELRAAAAAQQPAQLCGVPVPPTLCAQAAARHAMAAADIAAAAEHRWQSVLAELMQAAGDRWPDELGYLARLGAARP